MIRIRQWLLSLIAGNMQVCINCGIRGGLDLSQGKPALIVNCWFVGKDEAS